MIDNGNGNPRYYFDFPNADDVDGYNESIWENMEIEITYPIEIQESWMMKFLLLGTMWSLTLLLRR